MGEVDWESVKRLFAGARAQPEDRRDAWLANACAEPAVRAEVRSLLDSLERAGSFLEDSGLPSLGPAVRCRPRTRCAGSRRGTGSDDMRSSNCSALAAWARSTARPTRGSIERWS